MAFKVLEPTHVLGIFWLEENAHNAERIFNFIMDFTGLSAQRNDTEKYN